MFVRNLQELLKDISQLNNMETEYLFQIALMLLLISKVKLKMS